MQASLHSTLPKLVIVGNGMVTGRLLDELMARETQKYQITVIGAEPHGTYNRIMLSSVLAKDSSIRSIIQKDKHWYEQRNITFLAGSPVTHIHRKDRRVETANGHQIPYDHLVLATGSRAARIPAFNRKLHNIFLFRTIADTQAMMAVAEQAKSIIVVGGGLLGLEAAYGLAKFGANVTLVHRSPWLLNRQLDAVAGTMLKTIMASMGIHFKLNDEIASFNGEHTLRSITLKSGEQLDADMAVIATGITPNAELAKHSGLNVGRAVQVDDFMQSSDPHISAIGECVEHKQQTFGLVDPLWRQAETLAARLVDEKKIAFENSAIATKLKVSGVQVFSAGEVQEREGLRSVTIEDQQAKVYRKLLIENDVIKGIVLFGDVRSGNFYFDLMQNAIPIQTMLPNLIFGQEFNPAFEQVSAIAS